MKLATLRNPSSPAGTVAVIIIDGHAKQLANFNDVGEFLAADDAARAAAIDGATAIDCKNIDYAPVIPKPGKVICVGLNYKDHIEETGNKVPEYPTLFAKFADTLCGAYDDIEIPAEDHRIDWEAELTIVIGSGGRRLNAEQAEEAIAGYTVANDVSMRGYQGRTVEWLQGKAWDASTPIGPVMVTRDEMDPAARILTKVNGRTVQDDTIDTQVFSAAELVSYISTMTVLRPGDLILTGTPAGVALGRKNDQGRHPWLVAGDVLETEIVGIGSQRNTLI